MSENFDFEKMYQLSNFYGYKTNDRVRNSVFAHLGETAFPLSSNSLEVGEKERVYLQGENGIVVHYFPIFLFEQARIKIQIKGPDSEKIRETLEEIILERVVESVKGEKK